MIPEDPIRIQEIPNGIQNPETGRDLKERENEKERSAEGPDAGKAIPKRPEEAEMRAKAPEMPKEAKERNRGGKPGIPEAENPEETQDERNAWNSMVLCFSILSVMLVRFLPFPLFTMR
jgi:hypothetical protein